MDNKLPRRLMAKRSISKLLISKPHILNLLISKRRMTKRFTASLCMTCLFSLWPSNPVYAAPSKDSHGKTAGGYTRGIDSVSRPGAGGGYTRGIDSVSRPGTGGGYTHGISASSPTAIAAGYAHGVDPTSRPGTDVADPATYPFLPAGHSEPHPGPHPPLPPEPGVDLAIGRPYYLRTQFPDALFHQAEQRYADRGQLTDGKYASLDFKDKRWIGLYRQYGRAITVDLGKLADLSTLSLDFLENLGAGIAFPDAVRFDVSQDGLHWTKLGEVENGRAIGDYVPRSQAYILHTHVNARYVRAVFDNKVFGFIDEFSVYGLPHPDGHAPMPIGTLLPAFTVPARGYLKPSENSGGIHHLLLIYTGLHGRRGDWTTDDFLPMLRDTDSFAKTPQPLFDGMLICPFGDLPTTSAAWLAWTNSLFSPGRQLAALDRAAALTAAQLKDDDYRVRVVLGIPPTYADPPNFGTIDSGEEKLDFDPEDIGEKASTEAKYQAIEWHLKSVLWRWHRADFRHLELVGFYWIPESVVVSHTMDEALIRQTAGWIHRRRFRFFWIPYYGATGVTQAQDFGFDAVMLQPNVSFHWNLPMASRFDSVAEMAKGYGMGIECEVHWSVLSPDEDVAQAAQQRYFAYFKAAKLYGFHTGVVIGYYANDKSLLHASREEDSFYHRVYERTAGFIAASNGSRSRND